MAAKPLHEAFNQHLNKELYSAYLYLAMAAYFESSNLEGFTSWMKLQAREEYEHAMKFWEHILDRGGNVTLLAIAQPPAKYSSPLDAFQQAHSHEQEVSKAIHELYETAVRDKDYPAEVFLQWFVTEQVEEEKNVGAIVDKLKMVGDSSAGLLMLDREVGQRVQVMQ